MAFVLNSVIKIGSYTFRGGVNECTIKKSVHNVVDTATLKIPGLGRIVSVKQIAANALNIIGLGNQTASTNLPASSVETATLFKEGDAVSIDLGYNNDMRNEFRGFVRRVNLTPPISIEMEGYAWQLRGTNILASWKSATVREVLTRIIQGTDIVLSPDIPTIKITNFHIRNRNGLDALDYLKRKMYLTVYFADNVLYVGLEAGRTTATGAGQSGTLANATYKLGYNCVTNQPNLKKRVASTNAIRVRLKVKGKDGKTTLYEAGDEGGAVNTYVIPYSNDADYLKTLAANILKSLKYDGYEGKIKGFLQPYCQPGWKTTLIDPKYAGVRAGIYFVPSTEVKFGKGGAIRETEISYNLNV